MSEEPPSDAIVGFVDCADWNEIGGWCYDPTRPDLPLFIDILHGTEIICRLQADRFRADLMEAGAGTGRHGFSVRLSPALFSEIQVRLRVRVVDTGQDLEGSPLLLNNPQAALTPEMRTLWDVTLTRAVEQAEGAEALGDLAGYALGQFDRVMAALRLRREGETARQQQLAALAAGETSLSHRLRDLAAAVMEDCRGIGWPAVAEPMVSVVIPARDNFDLTRRCLASMLAHPPQASYEIILVDDASTDATLLAGLVFPGIRVIRNAAAQGFVGSVNAGAAVARGRHILFLNNDTEVLPGWLDELVDCCAADLSIGIVGSKLLFPDGSLQEAGGIVWRLADACNFGWRQDAERPEYNFLRDCDYVSGAALMIPRDLFETLGGFDTAFAPGYYEDTDLCFRVRAAGRRVAMQPLSRVIHHSGATSGTDVGGAGMKRFQQIHRRTFLSRWQSSLQQHPLAQDPSLLLAERLVEKRALFVDSTVPTPDQDAGSNAALEHMRALIRLGYKVSFVGADNMARISPYTEALQRMGVQCYYHPYYGSVEEILRRDPARYDLVYLHRMVNAVKYTALMRERYPASRILYSVADLHYLRAERQAALERSEPLAKKAAATKTLELQAMAEADGVIVHSSLEAETVVRETMGRVRPAVIPWVVRPAEPPLPFAERSGIVFVGGYNHRPNVDAAFWLVEQIMPLVWQHDPEITCHLVGSAMPPEIARLKRRGVEPMGHVPDLSALLRRTRLTVAPLRYGAGLKGKVLTSLAAGLPCIATGCALEGMDLPEALQTRLLAEDPGIFAARIVELYHDADRNAAAASLGLETVQARFSEAAIDAALAEVITPAARKAIGPPPDLAA